MTRRAGRKGRRAASTRGVQVHSGGDAAQLLPTAVHHHEAGNRARARALYQQIIDADPGHADALQYLGILCHQEGDAAGAEALIRRAIAASGDVAPYHDNLGTVLESAGRLEEALAAYEAAQALAPGDGDRDYNLGVVLERLGRLDEAERHYRDALEARPGDAECRFGLGNVLKRLGAAEQAESAYRAVLQARPDHAGARVNLGNLLQAGERFQDALAEYEAALGHTPRDAAVHHNMGRALRHLDRLDEARACFEQALRLAPDLVDARVGLAQVLERAGMLERALAAYRAACERGAPPEARAGLVRIARVLPLRRPDAVLERELLAAIDGGTAPAAALARALGGLLAARADLFRAPPRDDAGALARALDFATDALFTTLLERAVNVVPEVERWLRAARRALLLGGRADGARGTPQTQSLLRTLALQGALNEYVYACDEAQAQALAVLRGTLEGWLAGAAPPPARAQLALLTFACYEPLQSLAGSTSLPGRGECGGAFLAPVLRATLSAPLQERRLAAELATLGEIQRPVSRVVQGQYEEHPYPRWTELPAPSAAGPDPLAARLASAPRAPTVLVAGCGTGQEALALARRHPRAQVTGLDLSRASLAYGARMAAELGLERVRFVQGDLLEAARLGQRFDAVTASGVLHHLEQPAAGWRALLRCLAPDGVMRVALYSRAARTTVNAARERIRALGLAPDPAGVRGFRARVLDGEEPGLEDLLESEDFHATGACRDLVFHPVEHQFDLPGVKDLLAELDLRFLGFELPHPLLRQQFLASAAGALDDLDAWARFESRHPETFAAMYVLWCERRDPRAGGSGHA